MPDPPRLNRLHSFLGINDCGRVESVVRDTLTEVVLLPAVRHTLYQFLSRPTTMVTGYVIGRYEEHRLVVHRILPSTPKRPRTPGLPFMIDAPYGLGVADGLSITTPPLDWYGMWVVYANRQLPVADDASHLNLFDEARMCGLVDDDSVLLTAGWDAGHLAANVLCLINDEPTSVPVLFMAD